jgi:hypothetical protein
MRELQRRLVIAFSRVHNGRRVKPSGGPGGAVIRITVAPNTLRATRPYGLRQLG